MKKTLPVHAVSPPSVYLSGLSQAPHPMHRRRFPFSASADVWKGVEALGRHKRHKTGEKKMFCTNCGSQVDGSMAFCTKCGTPVGGGRSAAPVAKGEVKSHMVGAILQLIVCLPIGIVPLIYACRVNEKLALGDIAGAQAASKSARKWINIGTIIVGTLIGLSILGNLMSNH